MKIVDRYLLGEMVWPFLGGLFTFVVLITGHMLFLAIELIVDHRVPFSGVLEYIAYQVPGAAVMAMPVASLLASSLALNRLAADHELVALRASGVGLFRMMAPALLMGLVAAGGAVWLNGDVAPRARQASERLLREIVLQQKTLVFKPQRFLDTGRGLQFYAEGVNHAANTVSNLYAFLVQPETPPVLYWAEAARFGDTALEATASRAYYLTTGGNLTTVDAEGLAIDLTRVTASRRPSMAGLQSSTLGELRRRLREDAAAGRPVDRRTLLELHTRLALALACVVFALLAGPVALRFGRGQSLVGVLATILVVFAYNVIMIWLRMLGTAGYLPPLLAAYGQNAALMVLAVVGLWRLR